MIYLESKGDYKATYDFLNKMRGNAIFVDLGQYGQRGVDALSRATPVDTGRARGSWYYRITNDKRGPVLSWHNSDIENGTPVVILVQYGHGTGTGGYVIGRDFINPAIQPIFDKIADEIWKKVKSG